MDKKMNSTRDGGIGEDDEAGVAAFAASTSYIFPHVLNAAIDLDIFGIIAGAGLTPSDIAARLPIRGRVGDAAAAIDSMLRLLASYSLLNSTCATTAERRYQLTPSGKLFVAGDDSGPSLVPYQRICYDHGQDIKDLKEVVLGGGNLFEMTYRESFYQNLESKPERGRMFQDAMTAHSVFIMDKFLQEYHGFEGITSLVCVAGGNGATLEMIISKHPSIHGINFDLPEVIQNAPFYQGTIQHVGGDMFVQVPQGDAMLIKFTLHNWGDEQCVQVLRNCYRALPANKPGKVIALECMLPENSGEDVHSRYACQMNVIMLTLFRARERTRDEFKSLAKQAGFSEFKVVCYARSLWVMEFIKTRQVNQS